MAERKPLTFEQLKEKVGKPVYWPNDLIHGNLWGIVDFDERFPDDLWFCSCHNGIKEVLNIKTRDMKLYETETPLFNIGDTVYQTDGIRIYEGKIKKIIYDTESIAFDESALGKNVFLTRKEAEQKIK